jgi:hypothetical protein
MTTFAAFVTLLMVVFAGMPVPDTIAPTSALVHFAATLVSVVEAFVVAPSVTDRVLITGLLMTNVCAVPVAVAAADTVQEVSDCTLAIVVPAGRFVVWIARPTSDALNKAVALVTVLLAFVVTPSDTDREVGIASAVLSAKMYAPFVGDEAASVVVLSLAFPAAVFSHEFVIDTGTLPADLNSTLSFV